MPLNETSAEELKNATKLLIESEGEGVKGYLRQGEALSKMSELTRGMDASEALRVQQDMYDSIAGLTIAGASRFPKEALRSNMRAAYKSWVVDAGLGYNDVVYHDDYKDKHGRKMPMSLGTIRNYSALRAFATSVTPENKAKLMAMLHNYPWKVIVKVSPFITRDNAEQVIDSFKGKQDDEIISWARGMSGERDTDVKSFIIPTPVYDNFIGVVEKVAPIIQVVSPAKRLVTWGDEENGIRDASRSEVLEIMNYVFMNFSEEVLEKMIRSLYGEEEDDET